MFPDVFSRHIGSFQHPWSRMDRKRRNGYFHRYGFVPFSSSVARTLCCALHFTRVLSDLVCALDHLIRRLFCHNRDGWLTVMPSPTAPVAHVQVLSVDPPVSS